MIDLGLPLKYYYLFGAKLPIWGTMMFIGTVFAFILAIKEGKRLGIQKKQLIIFLLIFMFVSIIGMRIYHYFIVSPSLSEGRYDLIKTFLKFKKIGNGFDSFGAAIGILVSLLYLKIKKANIGKFMDSLAIPIASLVVIGRVGCFFAQCERGYETSLLWGILVRGKVVHPVALYYILSGIILLFLLTYIKKYRFYDGFLINTFLIYYPLSRFLIDFLRSFPLHKYLGMSVHQIGYFTVFILASIFMIYKFKKLRLKKETVKKFSKARHLS